MIRTWLSISILWTLSIAPAGAMAQTGESGLIRGTVLDASTGSPVVAAHVHLRNLARHDFSHGDGAFHFSDLRSGSYTVVVERLGYATTEVQVEVAAGEVSNVEIPLRPSALAVAGVVVTGVGRERSVNQTYRPTSVLSGEELGRALASSVAATIQGEPGIAMLSFGPAPAQPVIRGMSGDRVLVLEDGHRTGDLSSTAPDHAVGIDPVTARRIEVVRGPAGVLYGSNALGGVINVIREEVPRTQPEGIGGTVSFQAESMNRGATGAAIVRVPLGNALAIRGEVTGRRSGDLRTPLGEISSTQAEGHNLALGLSVIRPWGYAGVAVRRYGLDHGLPGEFQGEEIPGAHEGGVDAETERSLVRVEGAHLAGLGPFEAVEFDASLVRYLHDEVEDRRETAEGTVRVLGTSFDQLYGTANLVARHEHSEGSFLAEGAVGLFALGRDLITGGSFPGSRDAQEAALAAYIFEEVQWDRIRVQVGARYDWTRVEPKDTRPIRLGGETPRPVRTRTFGDLSGAFSLLFEARPGWIVGSGVSRSFRTPSISELFSDGPHLADFSYDVGNPELESEVGVGLDVFVRVSRNNVEAEATLFRNQVENFIYYAPTGEADPRFRRFPVFRARGDDAVFQGADGRIQWEAAQGFVFDGTLSYVQAFRTADDDPLPRIPPLNGRLGVRYDVPRYFVGGEWEGAQQQDRVPTPVPDPVNPGELVILERPTAGYQLFNVSAGIRILQGESLHSLILKMDNLTDRVRWNHLSRAKDVAPEPGRNLQLLYRVEF
ncbi:MAG: TonB-dependent receptor [Gemmatimonadota bacterium]